MTTTTTEQLHLVRRQHEIVATHRRALERLEGELHVAAIAAEAGKLELAGEILADVRTRRASANKRFESLEAKVEGGSQ